MRNIFFLLAVAITAFFVFQGQAIAQCPDGYTPRTVYMTINGCPYQVDLCVSCSVGPVPSSVSVIGLLQIPQTPPCVQTWTFQQVLQEVESQVSTWDYMYTYLCDPMTAPPCPNQAYNSMNHWVCWKIQCIEYLGEITLYYVACDYDNYCEETYSWCWQADEHGGHYVRTSYEHHMVGSINCTLEGWQIHVPTVPGTESECYIYHTPCNPTIP